MSERIMELIEELYNEEDIERVRDIICELKEEKDKIENKEMEKGCDIFKCECRKCVEQKRQKETKKRNVKEEDKKYECDNCGCRCINKKNLKRHKTTKKCSHIYIERIYTNATEKVSEIEEENSIKNKNNVLKNYERLFIKKIVGCIKVKQREIANYWNTEEGKYEKFIIQLKHIYKKKYQKYINQTPKKKKIVFRLLKK